MAVHEINPRSERVRRRRASLGQTVLEHLEAQGAELAGYALVTWDHRGEPMTSFLPGGPIGRGAIPLFVHGSLSQHVAVAIVEEGTRTVTEVDPA